LGEWGAISLGKGAVRKGKIGRKGHTSEKKVLGKRLTDTGGGG